MRALLHRCVRVAYTVTLGCYPQLIVSGTGNIDVEDWKMNTRLKNCSEGSELVQWFWKAVESYDDACRARLLQFVTGSPRVPIGGFKALQGECLLQGLPDSCAPPAALPCRVHWGGRPAPLHHPRPQPLNLHGPAPQGAHMVSSGSAVAPGKAGAESSSLSHPASTELTSLPTSPTRNSWKS